MATRYKDSSIAAFNSHSCRQYWVYGHVFGRCCADSVHGSIAKAAGAYLRKLFPRMFMFGFITSSCAALAALLDSHSLTAIISVLVALGFLGNAFILTPQINKYRDALLAGDAAAKTMFGRLHLLSVAVFLGQLLASGYIVIAAYLSS